MELIQLENGVIPKNWAVRKLKDIAKIRRGASPRPIDSPVWFDNKSSIGWLRISDVTKSKKYLLETDQNLSDPGVKASRFVPNGSLVMSICATVGRPILTRKNVCIHDGFVVFSDLKIDTEYLYYLLSNIENDWSKHGQTGSQMNLNTSLINSTPVFMPLNQTEQSVIASALSDTDAWIQSLTRLIEKKHQIKQGAMQTLLNPYENGRLKKNWMIKKLGEITHIKSGGTPSTSNIDFWNGDIFWCTPTDITALKGKKYLLSTSRKISLNGLANSSAEIIPANSILMTSRATIGDCAINKVPTTTNQGFKNLIPNDCMEVEFLYYLLATQKQRLIGLSSGSTFLEISKKQLYNFEVTIPEKPEQVRISTILQNIDKEITVLENKLAKAQEIKQGMMQNLLTGRIRLI
ncbi:TPA: restriction endonuclease subunit S [Legionella pneumophila]